MCREDVKRDANSPNGTQSTVIEGYKIDGSFGYRSEGLYKSDASYVSHAHGWDAGPTTTLTEFVVSLRVMDVQSRRWWIQSLYGGLERAKGGFTTGLGKFRAAWVRDDDGVVELTFGVPAMTEEVLVLSLDGEAVMTVKKADEEEPRKEEVQVSQSSTEVEIAVNASGAEYTPNIIITIVRKEAGSVILA
ncbi:glycoside hydrolase family 78 protein [Lasiodiplodia theobromae]|nr:glycoside hydrolase family 78 protein [Lasiodiplodia theobromae]